MELTDKEYTAELEYMVKTYLTQHYSEWFYWDVLPQATLKMRTAYVRATGDKYVLEEEA